MRGSVYPNCGCQDRHCPRHGLCMACHVHHSAAGTLPKCERPAEGAQPTASLPRGETGPEQTDAAENRG